MNKVVASAAWLTVLAGIWAVSPAVAVGLSATFRPDYRVRDFAAEYYARLPPNRVRWYDFKAYRLACAGGTERRAVVLHTAEFDETPDAFLARRFPECPSRVKEPPSGLHPAVSGIVVGRR